jgi:hypothetical protein
MIHSFLNDQDCPRNLLSLGSGAVLLLTRGWHVSQLAKPAGSASDAAVGGDIKSAGVDMLAMVQFDAFTGK